MKWVIQNSYLMSIVTVLFCALLPLPSYAETGPQASYDLKVRFDPAKSTLHVQRTDSDPSR
jgi:hypothetical protein